MTTILTGIQPSGELHLGNYFGAVVPCLQYQEDSTVNLMLFLANYHALTTVHDREQLQRDTHALAEDLLALGLNPTKACVFLQSDIPEVTELTLLLTMVTGMGLLQRSHAYKSKLENGISSSVGLFIYPVLMAADILIHRSTLVPVGKDQIQHVEMARDMATRFNEEFGHTFDLPQVVNSKTPKVPGLDGRKMSKSYGNTLSPFDRQDLLRNKIARIKTDSVPFGDPLPTEGSILFSLIKLLSSEEEREEIASFFKTGRRGSKKFGYGAAKQILADLFEVKFQPANDHKAFLKRNPSLIRETLANGAQVARSRAKETLAVCREKCGII